MAEINVEAKKHSSSSVWLWVLLALVAAAIIYFLTRDNDRNNANTTIDNTTSYIHYDVAKTAWLV
jgi:bacteriorhodopsin